MVLPRFSLRSLAVVIVLATACCSLWHVGNAWVPMLTFPAHKNAVACVAFSPDGQKIAAASDDGTISISDALTGKCERAITAHARAAFHVEFSPAGDRVLTTGADRAAKVWDVATGRLVLNVPMGGSDVWAAHYSPSGKRILVPFGICDAETGKVLAKFEIDTKGRPYRSMSVSFSPDGEEVAGLDTYGKVVVWDSRTGAVLSTTTL